jgi:UDP-N-acetylglucosamine--N-acetylmuramyl-(pentapeptide) pyrophosphoryl-undecaprenol N-acetylglucosamine transferase
LSAGAPGRPKTALVMAGGTGGHIFPGLAVAEELRARGWEVRWIGAPGSMEHRLVPPRGFAFESIAFSGVRGKGPLTLALLPMRLLRAFWQSVAVLRRVRPDVVVGLGGYITFPAGLMAVALGKPLVLHEQNAVAGLVNKVLASVADRVFTAFPDALKGGRWIGNPLRPAYLEQPAPAARFAGRGGPLRLLVVGGSLGARALNEAVPQALALIPPAERPVVLHQGGEKQIDALRAAYARAGVDAELVPFIDDTARAYAEADLVVCRAGASTVTELAAVGAAAAFVPFPSAVDDHQTVNAGFLVGPGAAWLLPQSGLDAASLAALLRSVTRGELQARAEKARALARPGAVEAMAAACEELAR